MKRKRLLTKIRIALNQLRSFLHRMLSDSRSGDVSSRRVIGVVGFLALTVMMFVNALDPKSVAPDEHLVAAVEYIVIAAILGTTADKFSKREKNDEEPNV